MAHQNNEEVLQLKVKGQDQEEIIFKIKKNMPLKKLMEKYCEKIGIYNQNSVNFIFEGEKIYDSQTPDALRMRDGDEIEVTIEQVGG